MALSSPLLTDFTAGELTPKLAGRVDLALYTKGCLELENWVPFGQGGVTSRPGSKYLGLTKTGQQGVLIPFVLTDGESYLVELTPLLIRFWHDDVLFGAPLELVSTYATIAQLRQIRVAQDGDDLYLFHKSFAIMVIHWTGATFTFAAAVVIGNTNQVPCYSAGNYPGYGAFFGGRLWLGGSTNEPKTVWASRSFVYTYGDPWVLSTAYEVDMVCSNDSGKLYRCITKGTSAAAGGPTGTAADIVDGTVHWAYWTVEGYLDFRYFDRISYTVKQLKAVASWADPDVPELEDVTTYRDVVAADCALEITLASDQCEDITGLVAGDEKLLIGTVTSEWIATPDVSAEAPWEKIKLRTHYGMEATVPGLLVNDSMIFAQSYGTKLREYQYDADGQKFQAADLTFQADHILGAAGIIDLDFALTPEPMIYCVRSDGEMAVLLYNKMAASQAWHRYVDGLAGYYESVAVIGGSVSDAVYVIVNRGAGYRCVEKFDRIFDLTAIPLDSWVYVAVSGATVAGLDRFTPQTVTIYNVTDGTVRTGAVAAGVLTLNAADVGDTLYVGAAFTCIGQTMRVLAQATDGTGFMQTKRVTQVYVMLYASYPFKLGYVNTAALLETAPITGPYSGSVKCPFNGNWDEDGWVIFIQDAPYHVTILAMIPEVEA